jgi:tetratricopeptide (TPR) repeat protein
VRLEPLSEQAAEQLATALLGQRERDELASRLARRSAGNPLFVEQLIAVLDDDGGGEDALPSTLEALIGARLDRLSSHSRQVLERAAVIGLEFSSADVRELTDAGPDLGPALLDLVRQDLVRAHDTALPGEEGFRFAHLLVRDAAYAGLPKRARSELHERLADSLERRGTALGAPLDEIVAYHLEQAYRYGAELDEPTERLDRLVAAAGERLTGAGRRAFDRGDARAAAGLWGRAVDLLPSASPGRIAALRELPYAYLELGRREDAFVLLGETIEEARAAGDRGSELLARVFHSEIESGRTGDMSQHLQIVVEAVQSFRELGDDRALAAASLQLSQIRDGSGDEVAHRAAATEALEAARRVGDARLEMGARSHLWRSLYFGGGHADEVIRAAEEIDAWARESGNRNFERAAWEHLARSYSLVGRHDEARHLLARARAVIEELGQEGRLAASDWQMGEVAMRAGDAAGAVAALRSAFDFCRRVDDNNFLSTVAAELAHALLAAGDIEESLRVAEISSETADENDLTAQVPWRTARAKALARKGELAEAERLVREAVAMVDPPSPRVILDLAQVLTLAGATDEALPLVREAIAGYEKKGDLPGLALAHAALCQLEPQ